MMPDPLNGNSGPATQMPKRRWGPLVAWLVGGSLIAYAFIVATTSDSASLSECQAGIPDFAGMDRLSKH